jgi:hypothetical protein
MDAWQVYMEEFRSRAERAQQQRFGRQSMYTEAAHDAYQAATDRLTREHGWDAERALVVMRGLNAGVQEWLQLGAVELDALAAELRRREEGLADGYGA